MARRQARRRPTASTSSSRARTRRRSSTFEEGEAAAVTVNPADSEIFCDLFGTPEMRALFSDRQRLQCMLDVEAALARVEARLGIVPAEAAAAITAAASADRLD